MIAVYITMALCMGINLACMFIFLRAVALCFVPQVQNVQVDRCNNYLGGEVTRVGFAPMDKNGNPDYSKTKFFTLDELSSNQSDGMIWHVPCKEAIEELRHYANNAQ